MKYWIILPRTGTKVVDEQIYSHLCGSLVVLLLEKRGGVKKEKTLSVSPLTKQRQDHKRATYLNEADNYLNIFPLLLQWAPINERGGLKLCARRLSQRH